MYERYIDNNMHTPELEQSLSQSKVFPMVKDLCYKYDLRVSQRLMLKKYKYDSQWHRDYVELENYDRLNDVNFNPTQDEEFKKHESSDSGITFSYDEAFVLDHQGIPQAVVYVDDSNNFCFQANYHIKDRGKDQWDRYTISSNKVSQVLKTLRRKKWQPLSNRDNYQAMKINTADMLQEYKVEGVSVSKAISEHGSAVEDLTYDNRDKIAEVLNSLYGSKNSISHATSEHYTKRFESCKKLNDRVYSMFKELETELANKFIAIGITKSGGWIVGEVYEHQGDYKIPNSEQVVYYSENRDFEKYDKKFGQLIIHKTHRVRHLEQLDFFDSLKPTLTMLKVHLQDWENKEDNHKINREYFKVRYDSHYKDWVEDLGCYYSPNNIYGSKHNPFGINWLLMAKPQ